MSNIHSLSIVCVLYYSNHLVNNFLENIVKKIKMQSIQIIFVNNSPEKININKEDINCDSLDILVINNNSNVGYGAALNIGVKYAQYQTIILCNPDIQISKFKWPIGINKHKLYFLSGILNDSYNLPKSPDLLWLLINVGLLRMYGKLLYPLLFVRKKNKISKAKELNNVDYFSGCFIITNSETLQKVEGFDEKYFLFFEENDLFKRADLQNIPLFITDRIQIQTKKEKSSSIDVNHIKISSETDSLLRYTKKYFDKNLQKLFFTSLKAVSIMNLSILCSLQLILKSNIVTKKIYYYRLLLEKINQDTISYRKP